MDVDGDSVFNIYGENNRYLSKVSPKRTKIRICSIMTSDLVQLLIPVLRSVFSVQIYDIQTGQKIQTLSDPALANNYKRNCATFNPSDDLVLNDGVMWDVRSARAIHKFDKFNMNISGVFHPNGLEVIVNTEIVSYCNTSIILL